MSCSQYKPIFSDVDDDCDNCLHNPYCEDGVVKEFVSDPARINTFGGFTDEDDFFDPYYGPEED